MRHVRASVTRALVSVSDLSPAVERIAGRARASRLGLSPAPAARPVDPNSRATPIRSELMSASLPPPRWHSWPELTLVRPVESNPTQWHIGGEVGTFTCALVAAMLSYPASPRLGVRADERMPDATRPAFGCPGEEGVPGTSSSRSRKGVRGWVPSRRRQIYRAGEIGSLPRGLGGGLVGEGEAGGGSLILNTMASKDMGPSLHLLCKRQQSLSETEPGGALMRPACRRPFTAWCGSRTTGCVIDPAALVQERGFPSLSPPPRPGPALPCPARGEGFGRGTDTGGRTLGLWMHKALSLLTTRLQNRTRLLPSATAVSSSLRVASADVTRRGDRRHSAGLLHPREPGGLWEVLLAVRAERCTSGTRAFRVTSFNPSLGSGSRRGHAASALTFPLANKLTVQSPAIALCQVKRYRAPAEETAAETAEAAGTRRQEVRGVRIGCLRAKGPRKPHCIEGSERVQLSGTYNVRKGKMQLPVNRWTRRQVILCGTCLIVSSVKDSQTGKMHVLPLIGGKVRNAPSPRPPPPPTFHRSQLYRHAARCDTTSGRVVPESLGGLAVTAFDTGHCDQGSIPLATPELALARKRRRALICPDPTRTCDAPINRPAFTPPGARARCLLCALTPHHEHADSSWNSTAISTLGDVTRAGVPSCAPQLCMFPCMIALNTPSAVWAPVEEMKKHSHCLAFTSSGPQSQTFCGGNSLFHTVSPSVRGSSHRPLENDQGKPVFSVISAMTLWFNDNAAQRKAPTGSVEPRVEGQGLRSAERFPRNGLSERERSFEPLPCVEIVSQRISSVDLSCCSLEQLPPNLFYSQDLTHLNLKQNFLPPGRALSELQSEFVSDFLRKILLQSADSGVTASRLSQLSMPASEETALHHRARGESSLLALGNLSLALGRKALLVCDQQGYVWKSNAPARPPWFLTIRGENSGARRITEEPRAAGVGGDLPGQTGAELVWTPFTWFSPPLTALQLWVESQDPLAPGGLGGQRSEVRGGSVERNWWSDGRGVPSQRPAEEGGPRSDCSVVNVALLCTGGVVWYHQQGQNNQHRHRDRDWQCSRSFPSPDLGNVFFPLPVSEVRSGLGPKGRSPLCPSHSPGGLAVIGAHVRSLTVTVLLGYTLVFSRSPPSPSPSPLGLAFLLSCDQCWLAVILQTHFSGVPIPMGGSVVFSKLRSLNLSNNHLGEFPEAICDITTLTEVNLSCNYLTSVHSAVSGRGVNAGQYHSAVSRGGQGSGVRGVSGGEGRGVRGQGSTTALLQTFLLDGNCLQTLPEELGDLQALGYLGLSFNQFSQLPAVLPRLQGVERLCMAGNSLTCLNLPELRHLQVKQVDLRLNKICSVVPEEAEFLHHVTQLDVRDNVLQELDASLFPRLEVLRCERNRLTSLTAGGALLKGLYASTNELSQLLVYPVPGNLTYMDVSRNRLDSVPDWVCESRRLEVLDLSHNRICELPIGGHSGRRWPLRPGFDSTSNTRVVGYPLHRIQRRTVLYAEPPLSSRPPSHLDISFSVISAHTGSRPQTDAVLLMVSSLSRLSSCWVIMSCGDCLRGWSARRSRFLRGGASTGSDQLLELPSNLFLKADRTALKMERDGCVFLGKGETGPVSPSVMDRSQLSQCGVSAEGQFTLYARGPQPPGHDQYRLRCLNASANKLESLPPSSQSEESQSILQELYLTNNRLSDKCVPLLTGHCHLRVLHLAYNHLQTFPASKMARLEELEEVDLSGNQLKAIPTTILSCRRMHTLVAHSNCIQCVDLSCNELSETLELLNKMARLEELEEVDLSGNQLKAIPTTILSCRRMHTLVAHSNCIQVFPEVMQLMEMKTNPGLNLTSTDQSSVVLSGPLSNSSDWGQGCGGHCPGADSTVDMGRGGMSAHPCRQTGGGIGCVDLSCNELSEVTLPENLPPKLQELDLTGNPRLSLDHKTLELLNPALVVSPDRRRRLAVRPRGGGGWRVSRFEFIEEQEGRPWSGSVSEEVDLPARENWLVTQRTGGGLGGGNIRCFRIDPSPTSFPVNEGPGAPAVWSHGYTEASGVKNKRRSESALTLRTHSKFGTSQRGERFHMRPHAPQGGKGYRKTEASETPDKLCVAALSVDNLCGSREALYGVFDGERNVEVPYLLQCTMSDVLAEELHKSRSDEDYMTNTFLVMQRKLGTAGQKLGGSAALCHIKHDPLDPGGCFTLTAANVGKCQAILCRDGKPLPLSVIHNVGVAEEYQRLRQHKAIVTEDNKVNGVTDSTRIMGYSFLYPAVLPRPHVHTVALTARDEFFIVGSGGLWASVSPGEAVEAVRSVPDALAAAKKLCTLAQAYGCTHSLSAVVVQLSLTEDCCCCCCELGPPPPPLLLPPPSPGPAPSPFLPPSLRDRPLPPAPRPTPCSPRPPPAARSAARPPPLSPPPRGGAGGGGAGGGGGGAEPPRCCALHPACLAGPFRRQLSCALSHSGLDSEDEEPIAGVFSNGSRVEVEVDIHCLRARSAPAGAKPRPLRRPGPAHHHHNHSHARGPGLWGGAERGIGRGGGAEGGGGGGGAGDCSSRTNNTTATLGRRRGNGSVAPPEKSHNLIEVAADAPAKKQGGYFAAPAQPDPDDQFIIPPELEEERTPPGVERAMRLRSRHIEADFPQNPAVITELGQEEEELRQEEEELSRVESVQNVLLQEPQGQSVLKCTAGSDRKRRRQEEEGLGQEEEGLRQEEEELIQEEEELSRVESSTGVLLQGHQGRTVVKREAEMGSTRTEDDLKTERLDSAETEHMAISDATEPLVCGKEISPRDKEMAHATKGRRDAMTSRKRVTISIDKKLEILSKLDKGACLGSIAREYNVGKSTVFDIKKHQNKIKQFAREATDSRSLKRRFIVRKPDDEKFDKAMHLWYCQTRASGSAISGAMITKKAKAMYVEMHPERSYDHFKASSGWLHRFKARHGIRCLGEQGDTLSGDPDVASATLKRFIDENGLTSDQVFNCGETGLYWRLLPTKTGAFRRSEKHQQAKKHFKPGKDRVTLMATANSSGDLRLPLVFIHTSAKPRCFADVTTSALPCHYYSERGAWMSAAVFSDWFRARFVPLVTEYLARKSLPSRAILLTEDGRIQCVFLPAVAGGSLVQPMDQGVLESLKRRYKRDLLRRLWAESESSYADFCERFTVKDALCMCAKAWAEIGAATLRRAWRKLLPCEEASAEEEEEEEEQEEQEQGLQSPPRSRKNGLEPTGTRVHVGYSPTKKLSSRVAPGVANQISGVSSSSPDAPLAPPLFTIGMKCSLRMALCLQTVCETEPESDSDREAGQALVPHAVAEMCLVTSLKWLEQQFEASPTDLLMLRELHSLAVRKRELHFDSSVSGGAGLAGRSLSRSVQQELTVQRWIRQELGGRNLTGSDTMRSPTPGLAHVEDLIKMEPPEGAGLAQGPTRLWPDPIRAAGEPGRHVKEETDAVKDVFKCVVSKYDEVKSMIGGGVWLSAPGGGRVRCEARKGVSRTWVGANSVSNPVTGSDEGRSLAEELKVKQLGPDRARITIKQQSTGRGKQYTRTFFLATAGSDPAWIDTGV
ncbi:hypothetical protein AAFF_G00219620 [Aldrovandia affinis]|uniref:Leucine rich repeat-containing protein n=1 Tax=Aldrovandia affinis TaxID=143900 RepID=A0AAD7RGD4_9TELE|nr:hypothetical protein AAFF_G00219620 [Aldrovandia affinis]